MIKRKTFPVGPFQCNCTILSDTDSNQAIIIDPGGDADTILGYIRDAGLVVSLILHTHAHFDHFLAAGEIKKATGAPICLHKSDSFLWDILKDQCALFGIPYQPVPGPDQWLADDEEIAHQGVVIHTPGHTPGSVSFWFQSAGLLLAGDTLFRRSIGRTDLWGGDFKAIKNSIHERLFVLDESAVVITGHGPDTTIGEEIKSNPILNG
jgi:hydroxyacylglutathione hydrolase